MALSFGAIVRIVMVAVALIALIVLQKPCAKSVSKFVTSFSEDAGVRLPDAGAPAGPSPDAGISLRGLTPEQQQQAIQRELDRARAASDSGADAGVAPDGAPRTP
jgi:hypothetical protein